MPTIYDGLIKSLSEEYDVGINRTKTAVMRSFDAVLRNVFKSDYVNVVWDNNEIDIVIRQKGGEFDLCDRVIKPEQISPSIIARIKKLIRKNMLIQKYDVLYQNIRTLENTLIKGFLSEKRKDDYVVNYNDYPILFLYRKDAQPENEIGLYKLGQTYLFYVLRAELILNKPLEPSVRIILTRRGGKIPELFIKKETGLDAVCLLRYPSIKSVVETDGMVPFPVIEKYSKEFHEKLEVKYVRR
jgi:hypothetical protein